MDINSNESTIKRFVKTIVQIGSTDNQNKFRNQKVDAVPTRMVLKNLKLNY